MTPEERFAAHEQWLLDHDRAIAELRAIQTEQARLQQQQSAVLLELTQQIVRLLDRRDNGRTGGA
jgi:hypothetical protein